MDIRGVLIVAKEADLREDYELCRNHLRQIITGAGGESPQEINDAIDRLMKLDDLYSGGPGYSTD